MCAEQLFNYADARDMAYYHLDSRVTAVDPLEIPRIRQEAMIAGSDGRCWMTDKMTNYSMRATAVALASLFTGLAARSAGIHDCQGGPSRSAVSREASPLTMRCCTVKSAVNLKPSSPDRYYIHTLPPDLVL